MKDEQLHKRNRQGAKSGDNERINGSSNPVTDDQRYNRFGKLNNSSKSTKKKGTAKIRVQVDKIILALSLVVFIYCYYIFSKGHEFRRSFRGKSGAQNAGKNLLNPWLPESSDSDNRPAITPVITSKAAEQAMKWKEEQKLKSQQIEKSRLEERRSRTRPPLHHNGLSTRHFESHTFDFLRREEDVDHLQPLKSLANSSSNHNLSNEDSNSTTSDDNPTFCGSHALAASEIHPEAYSNHHYLNSSSVVLITGVTGQLGFHLAQRLASECKVKAILPVDPMYPNTLLKRLRALRLIAILTKTCSQMSHPILLPFVGLNLKLSPTLAKTIDNLDATGEINYEAFKPTHIVHLSSFDPYAYRDVEDGSKDRLNVEHPYVNEFRGSPPIFGMQQSLFAMEHLLSALKFSTRGNLKGHFTFVSDYDLLGGQNKGSAGPESTGNDFAAKWNTAKEDGEMGAFYRTTKLMEELLVQIHGNNKSHPTTPRHVPSAVGLRLSTVYGPWGTPGALQHELAERAVKHWTDKDTMRRSGMDMSMLLNMTGYKGDGSDTKDFLYIDDAVDAIIAAMQYDNGSSTSPAMFNIASGQTATMPMYADMIENYMALDEYPGNPKIDGFDSKGQLVPPKSTASAREYLGWVPKTSLKKGIQKQLAWYLNQKHPHGSPSDLAKLKYDRDIRDSDSDSDKKSKQNPYINFDKEVNGNEFLLSQGAEICSLDDEICHQQSGYQVLPCASECSQNALCKPSLFDEVETMSRELTSGCDIVLYTTALEKDVEDMHIDAPEQDEKSISEGRVLCNLAFISGNSTLVKKAVQSVSDEAIAGLGLDETISSNLTESEQFEQRISILNGRLMHKGWILLWINDNSSPIAHADRFLLKLSPGRFFASSVKVAMYTSEDFPISPKVNDILFLSSMMVRGQFQEREANVRVMNEDGSYRKEIRIIGPEPEKVAALLLSPMIKEIDENNEFSSSSDAELDYHHAYRQMKLDSEPQIIKESPSLIKQKDFYARIPYFANRIDLRSVFERKYNYKMNNFPRTKWILHDMKINEGRLIRCDWYKEHTFWGNDLDQLSFAHVITERIARRKITLNEPDDRESEIQKKEIEETGLSDRYEWILLSSNKFQVHGMHQYEREEDSRGAYVHLMKKETMIKNRLLWQETHKSGKIQQ